MQVREYHIREPAYNFLYVLKIFEISATNSSLCSFYRCEDHVMNRIKGEEIMLDDFIRRMLRALIESSPTDEMKKADMRRGIADIKGIEEDQ